MIDKGSKSISPWFEGNFINCRVVEYYSKGVTKRYFRFPDESCLTITKYRTGRSIQFDVEISNIKKYDMDIVKYIKQEFLNPYNLFLNGSTTLRGAGQYYKVVGDELEYTHFKSVLHSDLDKLTFKLRRGLKIEFISK